MAHSNWEKEKIKAIYKVGLAIEKSMKNNSVSWIWNQWEVIRKPHWAWKCGKEVIGTKDK